jgi:protein TonB
MNNKNIKKKKDFLLDFIFSEKNKDYGAYLIKKSRVVILLSSFGVAALAIGAIYMLPLGISQLTASERDQQEAKNEVEEPEDEKVVAYAELSPPPPIEHPEPEQQEPEQKEQEKDEPRQLPEVEPDKQEESSDSEKLKEPEVKKDPDVKEGEGIPTQSEAKSATSEDTGGNENSSEQKTKVYEFAEQRPTFPGGRQEMMKFIKNNLQYPEKARNNAIEGNVVVQFVVGKSGGIRNIQVVKGLGYGTDQEAKRLVQHMPEWQPGEQKGKKVAVKVTLPIEFNLTNI